MKTLVSNTKFFLYVVVVFIKMVDNLMFFYLFEAHGLFDILGIKTLRTMVLIKRNKQIMVGIHVEILKGPGFN